MESTNAAGGGNPGELFTAEEQEWIRAVVEFQRATGKRFPTHVDYLRLAKSMGYRRGGGGSK